ncbi:MAG: citramalate synthase, partial [Oscillospiraceae bacterium]
MKIEIFDSTLRDGAQGEGISFSVQDKINIVKALDELGIDYIECGNPGSNPKDLEFFTLTKNMHLTHSRLVAFGSTRRRGVSPKEDANCQALLEANTQTVAIFGKSWDLHVSTILHATLAHNLDMISDTIKFFVNHGKNVIFDAEHFFDGYKNNPEYALSTIKVAAASGASRIVLCETNGGCFPDEVYEIVKVARENVSIPLGIHTHNDTGCAVANSQMAVKAGCDHVQGTYLGYGERCGNANLSTLICNMQLKLGFQCIPPENIIGMTATAKTISEITNRLLDRYMPYVGKSAFSHKGGMHIDGVSKLPETFEHVDPYKIGNERHFLMSEMAGKSTVLKKVVAIAPELSKTSPEIQMVCDRVKDMEHGGFTFENADASFELLVLEILGKAKKHFVLDYFKTIVDEPCLAKFSASAIVKVTVDGKTELAVSEGYGPVHALDKSLRRVLEGFYPSLKTLRLTDYKVMVLQSKRGTAGRVRVLITTC